MRVAVIGSGISGLAAARVLQRFGHTVTVYERDETIGGIWAHTYPEVRLQNVAEHYRLSDFPWPFAVEQHPTAADVMAYLAAIVARFGIDVRLSHEVAAMHEVADGWALDIVAKDGSQTEHVDHVIVATGLYGDRHAIPALPGREHFRGEVVTERDIHDPSIFDGKSVAVVGFGKTALDLVTLAAGRGARVYHVFRSPRWLLPRMLLGRHMAAFATARASTLMLPSWVHPGRGEAALHRWFGPVVRGYWRITEQLMRASTGLHQRHRDRGAQARMAGLEPEQRLTYQMRAAAALAPDTYYEQVRKGTITPVRGDLKGLSETSLVLADGASVPTDVVVLAVGWQAPGFACLPQPYRSMMTAQPGGTQLYRHVVHPRIPRLAFAGFNHSFLHIPSVEIAMIWYEAVISGDLKLPSVDAMEASVARVAAWKARNTLFEPARAHGIGNRIHQYLDVLLRELGVPPRRKRTGWAEAFEPYMAADYAGVFEDYIKARSKRKAPAESLPFDT